MGAEKFEQLLRHIATKYKDCGKKVAIHMEKRFVPLAKKRTLGVAGRGRGGESGEEGRGERLGGWGGAKCANWLTGSAVTLEEGAAKERCRRTLTTIGGELVGDLDIRDLQAVVTERPPTFKGREKGAARKYREIVMETASPCRFAAESLLAEYGFFTDRTPPYEKRFNGTELWWASVKNFYRFSSVSERKDKGVGGLVLGGMGRTSDREASGYITHTDDFALAVTDRDYDMLNRVDSDLAAALRKWDQSQGGM